MHDERHEPAPPSPLDRAADVVSVASDFGAIWIAVCAAQVLRGSPKRDAVVRLGAAGIASLVCTRLLKHFFAVPRTTPASSGQLARTPTSTRFPSGHTLAAFTSAIVLPRTSRGRLLALSFAAAVAWARVRVGHHETVDVAAGAAAGAVGGALVAMAIARSRTAP